MRNKLVLGTGAGLAAVAVGLSPVGAAFANVLIGPPTSPPGFAAAAPRPVRLPPTAANPNPAEPAVPTPSQGPTLSPDQVVAAVAAVNGNASFKSLAVRNGYKIANPTPWTERGSDAVIGAELTVRLKAPFSASTVLPGVRFRDGAAKGYTRLLLHQRIENATSFTVLVDLRTGAIVSVQPDDAARVTELPGNVHFPAPAQD